MRFLVTAGNTREMIDRVRDWGNIFTGQTGFSIAKSLVCAGDVDLLTSNRRHLEEIAGPSSTPHRMMGSAFMGHDDLRTALAALLARNRYDAVFMTAAVADYRPVGVFAVQERRPDPADPDTETWKVRNVQAAKVKSTYRAIAVLGEPTEKLIDLFRSAWEYRGILVKFKLEVDLQVEDLLKVAEASRVTSGADYIVANTLDMLSGPRPGAYLLYPHGYEWVARDALPQRMLSLVTQPRV